MLVSRTDNGLKKLEDIVNYAYDEGDEQFLKVLSFNVEKNGLFVCDFSMKSDYIFNDFSGYDHNLHQIVLEDGHSIEMKAVIFIHEATHFIDNSLGTDDHSYFSESDLELQSTYEKVANGGDDAFKRGLSVQYLNRFNVNKFLNDPVLNEKWLNEIKEKYFYKNDKDIELYMRQKRLYERKKYQLLKACLIDIYDALTNGKLGDWLFSYGHGSEYYESGHNVLKEFIAQISAICNCKGEDILIHEFGEKLAYEMIERYHNMMLINEEKDVPKIK